MNACLLGNLAQLQTRGGTVQSFENAQHFAHNSNRRGFGLSGSNHGVNYSLLFYPLSQKEAREI
jgi:hypothetical protein